MPTTTASPPPVRDIEATSTAARRVALADVVGLGGLVCFQLALAAGAPLARAAWGGEHTTLPADLRVATVVPVVVYTLGAMAVLRRAGYPVPWLSEAVARRTTWAFAVVLLLSALLNLASPSGWERFLMAPLALILGVSTLVVARSSSPAEGRGPGQR